MKKSIGGPEKTATTMRKPFQCTVGNVPQRRILVFGMHLLEARAIAAPDWRLDSAKSKPAFRVLAITPSVYSAGQ